MGDLRLYALSIEELRGFFGARASDLPRLKEQAAAAFPAAEPFGKRGRLGPIFRRQPAAPVISPTDPLPGDLDTLLAGGYVTPERSGATWRLLETLVASNAWGSTRTELEPRAMDDVDFALTRAGVSSAYGLRHLIKNGVAVNLLPVHGLAVGYHPHRVALASAEAYRQALAELGSTDQRELVAALVAWLDGFPHWAGVAAQLGRPAPDLIGFWVG